MHQVQVRLVKLFYKLNLMHVYTDRKSGIHPERQLTVVVARVNLVTTTALLFIEL